jgi:hypothetical protein
MLTNLNLTQRKRTYLYFFQQSASNSQHEAFFNWTTLRSIVASSGCPEGGEEWKGLKEIQEGQKERNAVYVSSTFIDAIGQP